MSLQIFLPAWIPLASTGQQQLDLRKHRGLKAIISYAERECTKDRHWKYLCMYAHQVRISERLKHNMIKHLGTHRVLLCGYCPETASAMRKTNLSQTLHVFGHFVNQQEDANQQKSWSQHSAKHISRPGHLMPALGLNKWVIIFLGFDLE